MSGRWFEYDFGTLWDKASLDAHASNLTELWWDGEKQGLLNLFAQREGRDLSRFSDYDKFRALCIMMPLLDGHPVKRHCRDFLQTHFSCDLPMCKANCDAIWRMTADELLLHPRTVADGITADTSLLWTREELPREELPREGIVPIFPAARLLSISQHDWQTWQDVAKGELDAFARCGCSRVYLSLPCDYRFVKPDLYHVEQVLAKKERDAGEMALLVAQVARFLCEECQKRGWTLILSVGNCDGDALLLTYLADTVGFPNTLWCSPHLREDLLFLTQMGLGVFPLVRLCDHPSDGELQAAIEKMAARYPVGMLHFACGGDVRNNPSERARLLNLLNMRGMNHD